MKKGKTAKINGFKSVKITYGTVDSINFKSLYLNIQTWVEPKKNSENWNRVVLNMSRAIKHTIHEHLNYKFFKENFIVDLDLRSSGLTLKKKSFLNLEINLYNVDENTDFKSKNLKDELKKLSKIVYDENFRTNDYFDFHLRKTTKEKDLQTI